MRGEEYHYSNLLEVHIISELHVLRVDSEHFQTADSIGDSDVNLTIEASWNIILLIVYT